VLGAAVKALYFNNIPQVFERDKHTAPSAITLMGGRLFPAEVLEALLVHSTFDHVVLPQPKMPDAAIHHWPLLDRYRARVLFKPERELRDMQGYETVVFMSPLIDLAGVARVRRLSGCRAAPATGIIHSLNDTSMPRLFMLLALAQLTASDALICSTSAGRTAVRRYNELLSEKLSSCGWSMPTPEYQTPVIPLGINTREFSSNPSTALRDRLQMWSGLTTLYFGRFSAATKADLVPLLRAFAQVLKECPHTTLIIAGDDTQYKMADELQALSADLAPSGAIRIIPNPDRDTKLQLYSLADVFVSPSDSVQETFGLTVTEAMAAGLPVVASDWNGYKDLIVEGETGFRITTTLPTYPPCFDALRAMGATYEFDLLAATTMIDWRQFANRVSLLLRDSDLRGRMSRAAQERARRLYDWKIVIASYEALWEELAARAKSSVGNNGRASLELDEYGYKQIFAHYPTSQLRLDVELRLVACDTACLTEVMGVTDKSRWFSNALFERILGMLATDNSQTLKALLGALGSEDEQEEAINIAHVCRLVKYGYVEIA
jgi:glycosyltransferase involved in cell wall biosynthesis